jgi:hypothetical protein
MIVENPLLFIRDKWENHRQQVIERSYLHCHAQGLHSIMLHEDSETRVRIFITTPQHKLYWNYPYSTHKSGLSLGYHAHHCDLTLCGLVGAPLNIVAKKNPPAGATLLLDRFRYDSMITGSGSGWASDGGRDLFSLDPRVLLPLTHQHMAADTIHTVWVEQGQRAAWMVVEGREDPNYAPFTWSDRDLTKDSMVGMYVRPNDAEVEELLMDTWLLERR